MASDSNTLSDPKMLAAALALAWRNPETLAFANCLRALSIDAVEAANSEHPGAPMGMADAATMLFRDFLKFAASAPDEDPGVKSVHTIYDYYKSNEIGTVVMGASFRNVGQIKALAGCGNLAIAPGLRDDLGNDTAKLPQVLSLESANGIAPIPIDEPTFRFVMNADVMATEKLALGIRNFDADHKMLIALVAKRKESEPAFEASQCR